MIEPVQNIAYTEYIYAKKKIDGYDVKATISPCTLGNAIGSRYYIIINYCHVFF